jgi:hypothetical protein
MILVLYELLAYRQAGLSWTYIRKKQTILYSESHKELAPFGYFPGNEGKYAQEV